MNFSNNLASIVALVFGVIILVAAALAVAKANFAKAQLEALRGDVTDYQNREERHEKEIQELQRDLATERVARQALEKVVTGRDLLEAINTTLRNHHEAAIDGQKKIYTTLEELVSAFEETRAPRAGGSTT